MCLYKGVVGSVEKIVLVVRYTGSHTESEQPMSADKEKLEGEEEVCAANGKQAILVGVLAAQRHIVACGISAPYGRTIAAHEKIAVLNLVKEKEVPK
jgi:hypothetical protein